MVLTMKKLTSLTLAAVFLFALLPVATLPATASTFSSAFNLETGIGTGLASDYSWNGVTGILTVLDFADIEITGTVTNGRRIVVAASATVNVTLNNVSISYTDASFTPTSFVPLELRSGAITTLTLNGNNILMARGLSAGIQTTGATLIIDGIGSLTAIGGNGAHVNHSQIQGGTGIGGSATTSGTGGAGGNITINGGTVTAIGDRNSAGIGGGYGGTGGAGGTVTINGGIVTATGNGRGADIGGGGGNTVGGAGGNIIINGGTVTTSSTRGISGGSGNSGGTLTMNGNGVVFARQVSDTNISRRTSGILFLGTGTSVNGIFYGTSVTLTDNVTFPVGRNLTIPSSATLTVPAGVTLTNNSTMTNNGNLANQGTIRNSGRITCTGTFTSSGTILNRGIITCSCGVNITQVPPCDKCEDPHCFGDCDDNPVILPCGGCGEGDCRFCNPDPVLPCGNCGNSDCNHCNPIPCPNGCGDNCSNDCECDCHRRNGIPEDPTDPNDPFYGAEGIDYESVRDIILYGSINNFEDRRFWINLTRETINVPSDYSIVGFSITNGDKWRAVSSRPFDNFFLSRLLNNQSTIVITNNLNVKPRRPAEGAVTVTFPTIAGRPRTPRLVANYQIAEDRTGATTGQWVLSVPRGAESKKDGLQIAVADSTRRVPNNRGWGKFHNEDATYNGIQIVPLRSPNSKPARVTYLYRLEPKGGDRPIAASRARRVTVFSQQRAPTYSERNNAVRLRANTYVSMNGEPPVIYTEKTDFTVLNITGNIEIWMAATIRRPASAKQVINRT
jgi:hypothetical protein